MDKRQLQNRNSYQRLKYKRENGDLFQLKVDLSYEDRNLLENIKQIESLKKNTDTVRCLIHHYLKANDEITRLKGELEAHISSNKREILWKTLQQFREQSSNYPAAYEKLLLQILKIFGVSRK